MSNRTDNHRPPSPLVKQLREKFDRMRENNEHSKSQSQSQTGFSKPSRVGNAETDGAYPLLPVCCFSLFFILFFSNALFDSKFNYSRICDLIIFVFPL
jgi:hypothetical protein